jgi:hypothetical protein
MKRQNFIQAICLMTTVVAVPLAICQAEEDLDQYGGLKSVQFAATGFFRVEKGERWWFVTPKGNAFLSFGLNHTNPDYLSQSYNVDYWKKQFGAGDASDEVFRKGFVEKVMQDLEKFGMNTLGSHSPKDKFGKLEVPYIQSLFFVRTAYWLARGPRDFPDVFSPAFVTRCERKAELVALPRKDDPYLMGYIYTNVPILTDVDAAAHGQVSYARPQKDMPTWPRVLRNLGRDAPGKKVFVSLMRERYKTIHDFNQVYGTGFSSFDDLSSSEKWSPFTKSAEIDDAKDNRVFLLKILEQYYSVANSAVRKFDPNHMIFGDTLNANIGAPDEVVATIARHTDLIAYQFYGEYDAHVALLDRWSKLTGKPFFHADAAFTVQSEEMPAPIGAVTPNQETRAERFQYFASQAFARPDFIGWHWCGWVEMWKGWKPDRQHPGLQDPFGNYRHPMPETMNEFGTHIYDYGLGKNP